MCHRRRLPEPPQGSTLFTLLLVSPQGSAGGATTVAVVGAGGAAPPPHGSELVGEVGDATPHGSAAGAGPGATPPAVPHGPDTSCRAAGTVGGGEGPAEPPLAATVGPPQGSAALSSIRAPCRPRGERGRSHEFFPSIFIQNLIKVTTVPIQLFKDLIVTDIFLQLYEKKIVKKKF